MATSFSESPLLIFDGACGTNLQLMDIPPAAWEGREGCNELLNVTAPEVITALHRAFIEAGAMVLETNTFGATRVVLGEYGLQDQVRDINMAAVANARRAIGSKPGCFVAGSLGPTTKLVSLGHITQDDLEANYREQADALIEAGVDALIIETCQDLLQVKTAVLAVLDSSAAARRDIPVMVSVTIEQTGTMLVGSDIGAVCATLEPLPVFSLGLNCATGPTAMESHIRYLSQQWPRRISCIPNQGLPEVVDGKTVYRLSPADYARHMKAFVDTFGVSIVGGCCGTTPEHIRALVSALQ
ncbi:MAG TPA: 5-methyltetrahydrofolate--homocysteine methyltransferase [Verrucomicrobia bacterium]|nr:5-methyltetrahydrofolate--homocysteine methyltransferase [Verrucomicrobiota bacterium]